MNVENQPLVEPSKIVLQSMHLKLGLVKNFVKAMNQEEAAFTYLWEKFPRLSEAKLKEGIVIGPQIRDLIKDEYLDKLLRGEEKPAWDSFKFVVKVFLGNRRAQKLWGACKQPFVELPEIRLQHVTSITRIWIFFLENCGAVSGEHGERFHQDIFFNGEEIWREMELWYARWLLLDFGKGCPYRGMQATGKTEKKKYIYDFVCVQ